jgi:hypothetical protein
MNQVLVETFRNLSGGQIEALINKLWVALDGDKKGEERLRAVLRDEQRLVVHGLPLNSGDVGLLLDVLWRALGSQRAVDRLLNGEAVLVIKEEEGKWEMFDQSGWLMPLPRQRVGARKEEGGSKPFVGPAILDYAGILEGLRMFFPGGTVFSTVEEYQTRAEALVAELQAHSRCARALNGFWVPVPLPYLPKLGSATACYEDVLGEVVAALKSAHKKAFPERACTFNRNGFVRDISIVAESRHGKVVSAMAKRPTTALFFVLSQGWSAEGEWEIIGHMPPGWALGGAIDTLTAITAFIRVFSVKGPHLDCAGVRCDRDSIPRYFPCDMNPCFDVSSFLDARGSGVLFFFGRDGLK